MLPIRQPRENEFATQAGGAQVLNDRHEIRRALESRGWKITSLVENALTVEGRTFDVSRVVLQDGRMHGLAAILRNCTEGDSADKFESMGSRVLKLSRRSGLLKVYAEASDGDRALAELTAPGGADSRLHLV